MGKRAEQPKELEQLGGPAEETLIEISHSKTGEICHSNLDYEAYFNRGANYSMKENCCTDPSLSGIHYPQIYLSELRYMAGDNAASASE